MSNPLRGKRFTSPSLWRREKGASPEVTLPIGGGDAACNCFSSNQTGLCSASDPDQTIGDDCECFNKGQDEDQRCQVNKRHKIILKDKDSPHQCSLIIESATIADSGQIKFYSNFGRQLISECSLVVNESPQADHKHAFPSWVVVAIVITVVLLTAILLTMLVYMCVKARRQRQANHQSAAPNIDTASASPIELPLLPTSTTTQDRLETQEATTMTTL